MKGNLHLAIDDTETYYSNRVTTLPFKEAYHLIDSKFKDVASIKIVYTNQVKRLLDLVKMLSDRYNYHPRIFH